MPEKKFPIIPLESIESVTLGVGRRCPTCGEYPPDFRSEFGRRVDEEYLIPKKAHLYTGRDDGTFYRYDNLPGFQKSNSPDGLYPVIIVPTHYIGHVMMLRPEKCPHEKHCVNEGSRLIDSRCSECLHENDLEHPFPHYKRKELF